MERKQLESGKANRSYAKYYDMMMTEIPKEKLDILNGGPADARTALKIQNRNDIFKPSYLPLETGYCVMEDGTGFVANKTFMPGVTADMFNWWFAWHGLEDLRYQIWDPDDHVYARNQNPERILDHTIPLLERNWNTVHHVLEDVGLGEEEIHIFFEDPRNLGMDASKIGTEYCAGIQMANGKGISNPAMSAVMLHMIREVEGGIELRSRFWLGYRIEGEKAIKLVPDDKAIPEFVPKALFEHNLKEFSHLASILPKVYEEERNNWI